MLRFSNAQAIVCEGCKAELVNGNIRVRVVEVLERQVPIRTVESNAVSQDLERIWGS